MLEKVRDDLCYLTICLLEAIGGHILFLSFLFREYVNGFQIPSFINFLPLIASWPNLTNIITLLIGPKKRFNVERFDSEIPRYEDDGKR